MMPKQVFGSVVITVILLILVGLGVVKSISGFTSALPGEATSTIPAEKLKLGEKHGKYTSSPPTSGSYSDKKLRDGFHTTSITDEEIVGALHQGKVAIAYNCQYGMQAYAPTKPVPSGPRAHESMSSFGAANYGESQQTFQMVQRQNKSCAEIIEGLRTLVKKTGQTNIILFPYNKMETRIALLSWGRMEKLMWMDETRVKEFIKAYRR